MFSDFPLGPRGPSFSAQPEKEASVRPAAALVCFIPFEVFGKAPKKLGHSRGLKQFGRLLFCFVKKSPHEPAAGLRSQPPLAC